MSPDQECALDALYGFATHRETQVYEVERNLDNNAVSVVLGISESRVVVAFGAVARCFVCQLLAAPELIASNADPFGKPPPDSENMAVVWHRQLWWGMCADVYALTEVPEDCSLANFQTIQ